MIRLPLVSFGALSILAAACVRRISLFPPAPASGGAPDVPQAPPAARDLPSWDVFNLPAPDQGSSSSLTLWATCYCIAQTAAVDSGIPLLDIQGIPLGPSLSPKAFCDASMEGTVAVTTLSGELKTYNFAGTKGTSQVDCTTQGYTRTKAAGNPRFQLLSWPYGLGTGSYKLVPYRSVATDSSVIPKGSVLYIPSANGQSFALPDGTQAVHDGYFFAADNGSAIKRNHIDVLHGFSCAAPLSFVTSSQSGTFEAHVVTDQTVVSALTSLHQK